METLSAKHEHESDIRASTVAAAALSAAAVGTAAVADRDIVIYASVTHDELKLLVHHYTVEKLRWSAEEPQAIADAERALIYWKSVLNTFDAALAAGDVQ
jgi:hypothetical protein